MSAVSPILRNDPRIRLAELKDVNVARFMASEASSLRRALDHMIASVENKFIERVLVNRIRKAVHSRDDAVAARAMLHETRTAYQDGSMETLPTFLPTDVGKGRLVNEGSANAEENKRDGSRNRPIIFYLSGGGFIVPPSRRQKLMVQRLSEATNCEVMLASHRLAPEHPFPSALEDIVIRYLTLLEQGYSAHDIFFGADTAGASVALGALQLLKRQKSELPSGVVLFSPWCDLSLSGWSYITSSITSNSPFRMETAAFCARLYLQGHSAEDSLASPIFADLNGWPPMLIHTSENDLHFDDAVKLTENGARDGCEVRLNYWDSPRHHLERLSSKDAERSYSEVATFIDRVWNR